MGGADLSRQHAVTSAPSPAPPAPIRRSAETLTVGAADDAAELEADRLADVIVGSLVGGAPVAPNASSSSAASAAGRIRRMARSAAAPRPATPRPVRRSTGAGLGEPLGRDGGEVDGRTAGRIRRSSGGRPIEPVLHARIQRAFGRDFDDVRIHRDSDLAPRLGARAFTFGSDIHFAPGEYRPQSTEGLHVLGHELAHVVQGDGEVHRLALPANVTAKAGMHRFDVVTPGVESVRKGGITRSGIIADIPANTLVTYDSDQHSPTYVKVTWGGQTGYVNRAHLALGQRLGTSDFYVVDDTASPCVKVWDAAAGDYLPDVLPPSFKADLVRDLTTILTALDAAEGRTGLTVVKRRNVMVNVMHQAALGAPVDAGLWPIAAANIDVVQQRVHADHAKLVTAGLITATMRLQSIEFTGADFHKHGQAPFFLRFQDSVGAATAKIVYKPSDLSVDRAIFGKALAGKGSVAQTMDPTGHYISQYTIVATEDAGHHKYGYMEFVDSGTPSTRKELLAVYKSLAANMALSYLVGLEDVHHENVLLLKDRVQVIDMEATTGMFKLDPLDLTKGGFSAMLWPKALADGIKPKLLAAIQAGTLTAVPATATVQAAMRTAFQTALRKAAKRGTTVGEHADNLADQHSRVVPVATSEFYAMVSRAKRAGNLGAWQALVDTDPSLVTQAKGAAGHTDAFVIRLLKSPGTYDALARGEVPFYSRDLSGADIFDELGNRIDATGCSKVGLGIDTEMKGRRAKLRDDGFKTTGGDVSGSDVMKIFEAQMLNGAVATMNNALLAALP